MSDHLYVSEADLLALFGTEITKLASSGVGLVPTLDALNAEVRSYLAAAGAATATSPLAVKQAAADIARFRLYKDSVPEIVVERWKAATKYLQAIAAGAVLLPAEDDPSTPEDESAVENAYFEAPKRLLSADELAGW